MMTDEKIKEVALKHAIFTEDTDMIEAAIREALDLDGWVRVTPETMPKNQNLDDIKESFCPEFIVIAKGKRVLAERCENDWWGQDGCIRDVTHWRELPAPPAKETKDV